MAREDSLLENLKKMAGRMNANYQPIVIKMLLEDPQHTITIQNIRKKFDELNFGRANFVSTDGGNPMGNSAIKSVREALRNFVKFPEGTSNGNVTLIEKMYDEKTKDECLKICGQKIADWHIKEITKSNYEMWHILPGARDDGFPYLDEFIKTNTIGVGWDKIRDISNLSDLEIEKTFKKYYDDGLGSFQSFTKIKPKDIVVLTRGQEEIIDFGIVTSDYQFHDVVKPSYPHRKNIVWLNQGSILASELPRQTLSFIIATCGKLVERKQEMHDVLSNTNIKQQDNQKYFILTQNVDSEYKDTDKQYHFQKGKPGSGQLTNNGKNAKFIIQSKIEGQNYFVGHGIIGTFSEKTPKNNEGVDIIANYSTYEKFEKPKIRTENVHNQMKSSPSYGGRAPAILPISRSLYVKIIGEDLTSEEDELDTVSMDNYLNTLDWKPNLVLYGPPGTGKTFIARELAKKIQKKNKLPDIFMLKGPWSNWEPNMARPNPSWATTDVQSNLSQYNLMKIGDYVIFQNNTDDLGPYTGVCYFGIGKITKLFDSSKPFFADEIKEGKILWQKRLEFEIIKKVDRTQMIPRMDGLPETKGLSRIANEDNIRKLLDEIESKWGIIIRTKLITFHPSYSYEDFIEGIRPKTIGDQVTYNLEDGIFKKICNEARKDNQNPKNKYVLIIDEVNRGNISKIFGELITLIEKDKRNNLSINLAYSKKEFSIPDNLYIIGTMNTADKSLIQMDTALRRRFTFMELMPDYELPQIDRKIGKINLAKLLEELNKKIRNQNLRDKQIGHSYFMNITNISELQRVFKYEIIPLLQDYFYDDYALLEKILGKKIISVKNMSINHKFVDSIGFEDELDKISRNKLDDENVNSDEEPVKNDND
jgi:hypothetical protein